MGGPIASSSPSTGQFRVYGFGQASSGVPVCDASQLVLGVSALFWLLGGSLALNILMLPSLDQCGRISSGVNSSDLPQALRNGS